MDDRLSLLDILRILGYLVAGPFLLIWLQIAKMLTHIRNRMTKRGKLFNAVWEGDNCQVQALVKMGVDVNVRDGGLSPVMSGPDRNRTPLIYAAEAGFKGIVKELLQADADVNAIDVFDWTALLVAVDKGQSEVVEILLKAGANLEVDEEPVLIYAVYKNHTGIARLLLAANADINARDLHGKTALTYALGKGQETLVNLLREYGAKE